FSPTRGRSEALMRSSQQRMVTGFVKNDGRIVKSLCDFCRFLLLPDSLTQRHYLEDDLGSEVWGVERGE
ncbi:MAG: hypothetical protein ACKN87_03195, partial [Microcystis aeruginosa]